MALHYLVIGGTGAAMGYFLNSSPLTVANRIRGWLWRNRLGFLIPAWMRRNWRGYGSAPFLERHYGIIGSGGKGTCWRLPDEAVPIQLPNCRLGGYQADGGSYQI